MIIRFDCSIDGEEVFTLQIMPNGEAIIRRNGRVWMTGASIEFVKGIIDSLNTALDSARVVDLQKPAGAA